MHRITCGLTRRAFLRGLGAASALAATGQSLAAAQDRAAPAAPAVRVLDVEWTDRLRQRAVPARVYLPASTADAGSIPLVLFSHGLGGSREGYAHVGRHLAGEGFASLHVQHTGSDRTVWLGGAPWALVERLQYAAREQEAIDRVHDLRFALDQVFAHEIGALLDPRRIAAAGHSYGANTALLAAGARVIREGRLLPLAEPRIGAVVAISTPAFLGEPSLESVLEPIRVPSLHISSTEDIIRIPGYLSGPEDRVAAFDAIGSEHKILALFEGGSHRVFTDRRGIGDRTLDERIKSATRELVAAFLAQVFRQESGRLPAWRQDHATLLSRFEQRGRLRAEP